MNTRELCRALDNLVTKKCMISAYITGAPGLGKTSVVEQIGFKHGLKVITQIISQIMPTDLRGIPVAKKDGRFTYYPPEFLPKPSDGPGILFLDEINQAPPAMQAIVQQLIHARRIGDYVVPDNWFIWAAGNRKEDMASIYQMPSPVGNRFIHFPNIVSDYDIWKQDYALPNALNEQILAFLAFKPTLLHKFNPNDLAWPSPRSWVAANELHSIGMDIAHAVGEPVAAEFRAYISVYSKLPDMDEIMVGRGSKIEWPTDPGVQYALSTGLLTRGIFAGKKELENLMHWLLEMAPDEWKHKVLVDFLDYPEFKERAHMLGYLASNPKLSKVLSKLASYRDIS
jgi:hypothetical protein